MKFKTDWWQRYQECEDLDGEDGTVKVTLSTVSPRVGHSLGQYYYPGGTVVGAGFVTTKACSDRPY
jgi:hypothetical protein